MPDGGPSVLVLREGTEGLSMQEYAAALSDRLPEHSVALAPTPRAERIGVETAPVVTGVTLRPDLLERARELELFCAVFAGADHLPLDALAERNVAVTTASGIHAPGIAEQVVGNLLTFARDLHRGWRQDRAANWQHYRPGELQGSTVTVVGLGNIGTAVVDRLAGFGVSTVGVRHTPAKGGPTDAVYGYDRLHDALAETDYLVLACPLTERTHGLLDDAAFATLPPEAVVVNVARGPVVDTAALVAALRTDGIRGAALDVTDPEPLPADHPLWRLENCLVTPHVGGHNPRHWARAAEIVAHNARAVLDGDGDLRNRVDP